MNDHATLGEKFQNVIWQKPHRSDQLEEDRQQQLDLKGEEAAQPVRTSQEINSIPLVNKNSPSHVISADFYSIFSVGFFVRGSSSSLSSFPFREGRLHLKLVSFCQLFFSSQFFGTSFLFDFLKNSVDPRSVFDIC